MSLDPGAIANRRWRRVAEMVPLAQEGPHVPSPCQSVCAMDEASGWCRGCLRTLPEIASWGGLNDTQKRQVWTLIGERSQNL